MASIAVAAPDAGLAVAWIWRIVCSTHVRRSLKHNLVERSYRTHERAMGKSRIARSLLSELASQAPHMHGRIYATLKMKASTALTPKYFYNVNYELYIRSDARVREHGPRNIVWEVAAYVVVKTRCSCSSHKSEKSV